VAELERSPVNQETIRCLLDTCQKLAALEDTALSAASFAELSIVTGDRQQQERALSYAAKMEIRESAYGSFSFEEIYQPAVRAAILLGLAVAACSRGDSLDELLLGATRDLLFLGGDLMYRMAALGVCADLLSDDCLGEAIQLTVNKQASTSARAEFLVCLTPRLAQDSLRAAISASKAMPEDSERSWCLNTLLQRANFLSASASEANSTRSEPPISEAEDEKQTAMVRLRDGLIAISNESGGNKIVQRLVDRTSVDLQRRRDLRRQSALSVAEPSWPDESLDRLCDPARTVLAPQVLEELAQLAWELDDATATGDELFRLARDAVVAAQLASAQHSVPLPE